MIESQYRTLALAIALTMISVASIPMCCGAQAADAGQVPLGEDEGLPLSIVGDADFSAQAELNRWTGDGTWESPYIIPDLDIVCDVNQTAIGIYDTTVHFELVNCSIAQLDPAEEFTKNQYGIKLDNVTNCRLSGITASDHYMGINIWMCQDVRVDNCTITDTESRGISVTESTRVVIENTTITGASGGIAVSFSDHCLIQCNNVSYNHVDGIALNFFDDHNTIRWNVASFNGWYNSGEAFFVGSPDNTIYGNVFVAPGGRDSMPVKSGCGAINNWSSPDGVGNYYGTNYDLLTHSYTNFTGSPCCSLVDEDGDGTSDEPFEIPGSDTGDYDPHPLIFPVAAPNGLTATVTSDQVNLSWEEPSYYTDPLGHYTVTKEDGNLTTSFDTTEPFFEDRIEDVRNWTLVNYTVGWAGRYLTSAPSEVAIGQNPDKPTVRITSDLGSSTVVIEDLITITYSSLDPMSVHLEWEGYDSNSDTMSYMVRLDEGAWWDNGESNERLLMNLAEGTHTVTVRATDPDQNVAEDSATFMVYRSAQMEYSLSPAREDGETLLLVNGTVYDMATGEVLNDIRIDLAYSVDMGRSWETKDTRSDENGCFQFFIALEIGAKLGLVLSTELIDQNLEVHDFIEDATYVAVDLQGRDGVFIAHSMSTISDFKYTSDRMWFNVTGDDGTEGSTVILVPKDAVDGVNDVSVTLDGMRCECHVSSTDDHWVLSFNYTHSTHQVVVDLAPSKVLGIIPAGTAPLIIAGAIGMIALAGVGLYLRRRRAA